MDGKWEWNHVGIAGLCLVVSIHEKPRWPPFPYILNGPSNNGSQRPVGVGGGWEPHQQSWGIMLVSNHPKKHFGKKTREANTLLNSKVHGHQVLKSKRNLRIQRSQIEGVFPVEFVTSLMLNVSSLRIMGSQNKLLGDQ